MKNKSNLSTNTCHRTKGILKTVIISAMLVAGGGLSAIAIAETAQAKAEDTIPWQSDLNTAFSEAKKQNKNVLLRFSAEWCPPCRVMDIRVWPDESVQFALASDYVAVKADIDTESGQALAAKYHIVGVPTLILLDPDGNELSRGSFMSSPELVDFLKSPVETAEP